MFGQLSTGTHSGMQEIVAEDLPLAVGAIEGFGQQIKETWASLL